ncbi:MAG TPA: DUF3090 family protein [Acidimicrobiales bacterium]|nr:DUF3090 family protein [Acidimicrobiales bacterium]
MSPTYRDIEEVGRITIGTVGEVGSRVFLLQVRAADELVTLKLEKQQVSALSEFLGQMLRDLARPGHLPEDLDLEAFSDPDWVIGTIGIHYDQPQDKILLLIEEMTAEQGEVGSALRVMCSREQAAALSIHGAELVASGRPPCPICGFPLDQRGHNCPRTNGHVPPLT